MEQKTSVPKPNDNKNRIVFNYGQGNIHGLPTQVWDYMMNGWTTEHHTLQDGNYEIDLNLMDNTKLESVIKKSNPTGMPFKIYVKN